MTLAIKKCDKNSSQRKRLSATAKIHKFNDPDETTVKIITFRLTVDRTSTATYDAAKVIDEYLKRLACNEYEIEDFLKVPYILKVLPPLQNDEEYISYDVDSLFTNIPLKKIIDCIMHKIYIENLLKPICKKPHIQAPAVKIDHRCGCAMGGPLY